MEPIQQLPSHPLLDKELIIGALAQILNQILEETSGQPEIRTDTRFHAATVPSVSVRDYLRRIAKYAHCSDSVFIVALIYLDRLQERNGELVLTLNCVHR